MRRQVITEATCDYFEKYSRAGLLNRWCLSEQYYPRHGSYSLEKPSENLSPNLYVDLKLWLLEASPELGFQLQSGLIFFGSRCIYEKKYSQKLEYFSEYIKSRVLAPPGKYHRRRPLTSTTRPLTLLSTHNNPNYFHWLTLPGTAPLFLQDHFGILDLKSTEVALSTRPRRQNPKYVSDTLNTLFPNLNTISNIAINSTNLTRFSMQESLSEIAISPSHIRWLAKKIHCNIKIDSYRRRKLFISRESANSRRCINEAEIMQVLGPLGFESLSPDAYSVHEQMRAFGEASVIIGPHGAGLSNIVACAPESIVIELLPFDGAFSHYYLISSILGLRHGHIIATDYAAKTHDFSVDPLRIKALLCMMLQSNLK